MNDDDAFLRALLLANDPAVVSGARLERLHASLARALATTPQEKAKANPMTFLFAGTMPFSRFALLGALVLTLGLFVGRETDFTGSKRVVQYSEAETRISALSMAEPWVSLGAEEE